MEVEITRKKKAAALLLLMQLRENEKLLQEEHILLQVNLSLFQFSIFCLIIQNISKSRFFLLGRLIHGERVASCAKTEAKFRGKQTNAFKCSTLYL